MDNLILGDLEASLCWQMEELEVKGSKRQETPEEKIPESAVPQVND